ncbi:ADP-ribosylation factor-binding protein GGA3 [Leptidea sinapis]|uniref:ADP-ribosylation factor-binding protein GGA3 n=1 Tax=Leptidea sinapis TaxID=189913 RepID=UPI00213A7895|nr:ADP-ribosylation factor-binding protein GGA3 [Leptidea sinapis]
MMNVTFTSLEALILKATNECLAQPDPAAIEAFYTIMLDSTDGPQLAAQALATRIHAPNSREALLALSMIDRCMRKGDANFHAEIGKFRFLNEMIKLVSPKYLADRTTPEIRTRVLQLLHAWSIEYPKESKIKVAYDMLKNQGVIKETPPPLPPEKVSISSRPRIKSAIFEDEKKSKLLQKLLQSKKPEDLQHANRLIKTMVKEEERRNEANSRRAQEVSAALDSAGLLRDMLEHSSEASADEEQLIHELHTSCARLRPILQHLAAADSQAENLSDILNASDVLDEVFEKYNSFVIERKKSKNKKNCVTQPSSDSLLDFAGAVVNDQDQNTSNGTKDVVAIDELGDIFSNDNSLRSDVELLKPVNLFSHDDVNLIGVKPKAEGWNELDSLGEELLKKSLPKNIKRIDNFSNKHAKKIPMNALEKSSVVNQEMKACNNHALLDLDFFTKKENSKQLVPQTSSTTAPIDDIMVDITDTNTSSVLNDQLNANDPLDKILDLGLPLQNIDTNSIPNKEIKVMSDNVSSVKVKNEMKPLTDINVTLDSVHPSKVSPLVAFEEEEGVTVVLHFCKDKPRTDVNVLVVSTTSKRTSAIEDYKFHAVVPKGCKVRLLTASSTSLPPFNPFLPPPALTQVMLIARPPAIKQINLKFVITYTCDDDVCSEMGEVTQLPLDDV